MSIKLYFAPPSPYARKVRVLIEEKGLSARVVLLARAPFEKPADLVGINPLSKVPTLVTDDGMTLFDSPVICEYLDTLADPHLIPQSGRERWTALRQQALADGILDAGVSIFLESRRVEAERSPGWIGRQTEVIGRSLEAFEAEIESFPAALTIGHVALGCTLGWLNFRLPTLSWEIGRSKLAAWNAKIQSRPSMQATRPS